MDIRTMLALAVCPVLAACHSVRSTADTVEPPPAAPVSTVAASTASVAPANVGHVGTAPGHVGYGTPLTPTGHNQLAAFAAGCFWGVEDAFRHVPGVVATAVGFTGGHTTDPTYPKVCAHDTGHAETVLVEFDPTRVPYEQLLRVFFKIHDPTQVNQQGPDVGDQYRSAIFTFSDEEMAAAQAAKNAEARALGKPVATKIQPIGPFYEAEDYHQQYSEKTGSHACPIGRQLESM